ncbi:LacI family DNA-binding transcriptional regulator [Auraticoccus sp. F435]|uniref:LacI family DNA-binding transcriptional regulator n=2 Tax=Auraticoccus cholistanensis TaxID=2656650 RepID=A0A6A9V2D4_9ACTN|nr:LacI family DNA-binding transcriptional regulator [Auraticoccus cholistanensis]MVA77734.1 LacI family DNA-binding transcriptional regulator [Auraticoccus cholistanensis]
MAAVAAEVGVSVPTVSKVLNGRPDVSPATRARVEIALQRSGYRRRRQAQPGGTPPLLDLVFHEIGSAWATEIIRGVEEAASAAGVGVVLSASGGHHHPGQGWVERVLARRPVGVISVMSTLHPDQRRRLASRSVPLVVLDTDGEPPPDVPTVGSSNWHGGLSATRHLLELGHRRVAVVTGPADVLCSRARVDGFRSAHDESGVTLDPALVRYGDFEVAGGHHHGRELLSLPERPTAVFAGSDMQALGVLRAARELGLRVPADLSVVGYDDLPLAAYVDPPLTTVHQPLRDMAVTATRMLLDPQPGDDDRPRRVELGTHLVVRDSTAPPPPR